jgi:hypothetical protein
MSDRLIFVSCGQSTDAERQLGRMVHEAINSREGFKAYWADSVQSLAALGDHVFDGLRRCAGVVVLLHDRREGHSSMWINQELAVLAYRQFLESVDIPILVLKDQSVTLEGAMTAFIVNARPLPDKQTVIDEVHRWLTDRAAQGPRDEQAAFDQKWSALTNEDQMILEAIIQEGSQDVKEVSIRRRLMNNWLDSNNASNSLRTRLNVMSQQNLVRLHHNLYDGDEISLHRAWEWYIRHAVRQKG